MKQLTCEMCGSTDLMKQDGVFVCQSCGCKYSVEEAKKMMVEGAVDVSGSTIKVDNSAFVQKYLENARRAKEKEDWEETEKYYNMVEQNDPNNIEAIFYSSYGKAKTSLMDDDIYKRQSVFKVLCNSISIIDDNYQAERLEENKKAIEMMATDIGRMLVSEFVYTKWKNGYGIVVKTNKGETHELFRSLLLNFKASIENIIEADDQLYLHTALLSVYNVARLCDYINSVKIDEWITEEKQQIEMLSKKAIAEYWAAHPEEKTALETEKATLNNQIAELNKSIDTLPEVAVVKQIEEQIEGLRNVQLGLGLFKGKEKKALQAQIDNLTYGGLEPAKAAQSSAIAPIQTKIDSLNKRIEEIDTELTQAR